MNWVLMLVLLVLVCCAIYGYTKGFLRIVFSLVAWVIVLVFVSWATPHVSQWIQENTTIYEKIEAACEESVRRAAQGKMEEGAAEQYGVAVDEQRVEVFRRLIRHGPCRRIGQLVLRPHHIRLEGEGVGIQQGTGLIRGHTVIGSQLLVVEDLYLQIGGEDVLQRRLDVLHETGLDGAFFEGVAAMQHEGGVLHGDHVHLVEPCADGGLAELLL